MFESVTLFQEFFGVGDIVNRMLGDLQTGYDLLIRINGNRCFQESFSRLTGSPGIVVTGVRAGKPGRIDSSTIDRLTPIIEHFHEPVQEPRECCGSDSLAELMDGREMGNLVEMDLLSERIHNLCKLCGIPVIF